MLGGGMGGTALAEQSIASGLVVAFIAVSPLLLVLFNLAYRVYPHRNEVLALIIGLVGVLLLTRGAGINGSASGLLAILCACTAWSLGSVLSLRGFSLAPGATGFASEMLCGGLALLLISTGCGEVWQLPTQAGPWLAWTYLVIFGSLIAFNAYMLLLAQASTSIASSYTLVNPVVALLLGISVGREVVTPWEWMSVGVIMLGVALLFAGRRFS
jgi:drug/metabolite transporter (DMT)-like permease